MSVLINMEMPKTCEECALNYDSFACIKTGSRFFRDSEFDPFKGRLEDCPLISVPPHGRLIDADALANSFEPSDFWNPDAEDNCFAAVHVVNSAPTIIPAEEEETT